MGRTDTFSLVLKLLSLVTPEKWFDLRSLASWIKKRGLSYGDLNIITHDLRRTMEDVFFLGWVEMGFKGKEMTAFLITSAGAVALGNMDSLPQSISQSKEWACGSTKF